MIWVLFLDSGKPGFPLNINKASSFVLGSEKKEKEVDMIY